MKYYKPLVASSIALAVSSSAFADSDSWQLLTDNVLDGIVENADEQTLNYTKNHNNFQATADTNSSIFMGDLLSTDNGELIRFQEVQDNHTVRYSGVSVDSGYQGTWYSTNGSSGDFSIDPDNGSQTGSGGGYNSLGLEFDQAYSTVTIGEGNLTATGTGFWRAANTNYPISSGKWYWEIEYKAGTHIFFGVNKVGNEKSYDNTGAYYPNSNQTRCNGRTVSAQGKALEEGDVFSVMLDMDTKQLQFALNGSTEGIETCTLQIDTVYPAVSLYQSARIEANFGQKAWVYPELAQ